MQSSLRASHRPGSVSAGTQASPGKSGLVSADTRVPYESTMSPEDLSAKGSADPSKTASKGSADPSKTASKGSADPSKTASKGSADPFKTASTGSAGPPKTAALTDDTTSTRCTPSKVRVEGVRRVVDGASSGRPQVPPKQKDKVTDRHNKAKKNLVLSNQYSALSDDEMESSSVVSN